MPAATLITIDIVSDLVCPWCYIGKRHLEKALEGTAFAPQVRWHPFQLNPTLPPEGIRRADYVNTKFGGPARAAEIYSRVGQAGKVAGLNLNFEGIGQQANTLAGHALVALAQEAGKGDAVVEALFRANFIEGRFIGDLTVLTEIGVASGLDRDAIEDWLHDPAQLQAIAAQDQHARAQGISGVPFFIFNGTVAQSGAQPPDELRRAMHQASN
jgi:predicted DsbA family dithiol-disulfide isomerase